MLRSFKVLQSLRRGSVAVPLFVLRRATSNLLHEEILRVTNKYMKLFNLKVHPDFFQNLPKEQRNNLALSLS